MFSTIRISFPITNYQNHVKIHYLEMLLSLAFGRLLFVSGFGWLFYMCSCGKAGNSFILLTKPIQILSLLNFLEFLNKILSWKYFLYGNKLVYGIFLNHFIVLIYRILSAKQTFIMNHYNLVSSISI